MTDKVKQFLTRLIQEEKGESHLANQENKFMTKEEFEKQWAEAQKYYEKHPEAAELDIVWDFDLPEADGISPIERYVLKHNEQKQSKIDKISRFRQESRTKDLAKNFGISQPDLK